MTAENKKLWIWGVVSLVLLIPALFLNLEKNSFIEDEGTRGVVAMEMIYQKDFITPTISGEYYYNKPPFYNWIIAGSFLLFGNFSAFALRFPMAVSVILYGITVFFLMKRRLGNHFAFILALTTVTSGRILIYDSLHGLIDVTMGWFTFVLFVSIFELYERQKFYWLFIVAYVISACTFLMKGLPSIAFLGISLLTLFIYKKDFKRLFTLPHLTGILLFVILVGGYYLTYSLKNNNSLLTLFKILFVEANKKSVGGNEFLDVIIHLFEFPFEYLVDFLPYTIFILFFIKKKNIRLVWENQYTRYLILIFIFNILIFWISPIVYARYLLMFIPLAYTVLLYPYMKKAAENPKLTQVLHAVLTGVLVLFVFSPLIMALVPQARVVDNKWVKAVIPFVILTGIFISYLRTRKYLLLHFILSFLVVRIAFNLFIVPIRTYDSWHFITQKSAIRIGEKYKDQELCIYDEPSIYHEPDKLVLDKAVYFMSKERGEVVPLCTTFESGKLYIVTHSDYHRAKHQIIDHLYSEPGLPLYVVKVKNNQ
jgi:4-amino-4-deoxy-L-arabinose transferase-like glycosyltransferase